MSLAIVKPAAPEPDALTSLHAEKIELQRQADELAAVITRLKHFEGEETASLATIGEIGRREVAAMVEWASTGGVGDAPAPLSEERAAAAQRLAAARQQIEAGSQASAEIEARRGALQIQMAEIDARIDAAILDVLENEFHAARVKFAGALADVRLLAADVFGARGAILSQAEALRMRGQADEATAIYRRVEVLDRQATDLDASPLIGDVNSARDAASARALVMKAGIRK